MCSKTIDIGLTVNIHVSTKTCVTGNNLVLHKALFPVCLFPGQQWKWRSPEET